VEWNKTQRDYPEDRCLHQLFEEQVTRTPEAVAVIFEGQEISYAELNRRANQLAHYPRKRGVGPDVLVGLCVERSLEMMVGLLGILKSGGAYVPLDPAYPKERLAFMLEDAQVPVLLTQQRLLEGLPEQKPEAVCLDSDWEILAQESQANPACLARSHHLAYTIYTSGSTGKPKGSRFRTKRWSISWLPCAGSRVSRIGIPLLPLRLSPSTSPDWNCTYDIVLHMWETGDGLSGMLHYSTDLFNGNTIDRMMTHFRKLLVSIVADPQGRVLDLPLIPDAEAHQMLVSWNDTRWEFPRDQCLHELFEYRAQKAPESVAVVFGTERLTYGELDGRANQLAHYLRRLGVGPDVLVGLSLERSLEMVVGILGIMKAGGAYLPLDPNYPQERLNFMVQDTRAAVVLTQQHLRRGLGELPARIVCLDAQLPEIAREGDGKPDSGVCPLNLSYVIFTSGSTGTPKGIAIQHRGVLNNIVDLNWRHDVGPADRMLCLSSLSFDMCVYEVFGILEADGAIVMPQPADLREPARWASLIHEHRVTVWNSAPALLKMLVDYVADRPELWPRHLHLAILGGDWVPVTMPDRLKAMAPHLRFIVLGGATEASIHSIIYPVEKTDPGWKSIPYGKPQYNQKAYILNPRLQPTPVGVAGEFVPRRDRPGTRLLRPSGPDGRAFPAQPLRERAWGAHLPDRRLGPLRS
jgi:amino acid adenylation domain-containing protein